MGANDVANAFGTTVGSGSLSLWKAYVLASIFESLGAILVGYTVIDTIRKGVIDVELYADDIPILMLGQIAILGGCGIWLLIATVAKMPISTTHSIVGATLGFTLTCKGFAGVNWKIIAQIGSSWVTSPLFSGIITVLLYILIDHLVIRRKDPIGIGLHLLPIFYFVTVSFNTGLAVHSGSKILGFGKLHYSVVLVLSIGTGIISALFAALLLRPILMKKFAKHDEIQKENTQTASLAARTRSKSEEEEEEKEPIHAPQWIQAMSPKLGDFFVRCVEFSRWLRPDPHQKDSKTTQELFSTLQVFTACFASFAHGANDVSNAIAPLSALDSMFEHGDGIQTRQTSIGVLIFGTASMCLGLCILGYRVIRTIGSHTTSLTPASGFCVEFGAALTGMIASKMGLPISTPHCVVGSVIAVGIIRSGPISYKILHNIVLSWVITVPASGVITAFLMLRLKGIFNP